MPYCGTVDGEEQIDSRVGEAVLLWQSPGNTSGTEQSKRGK